MANQAYVANLRLNYPRRSITELFIVFSWPYIMHYSYLVARDVSVNNNYPSEAKNTDHHKKIQLREERVLRKCIFLLRTINFAAAYR